MIFNKKVIKLFRGRVDIRSYERDEIIKEKKTLVVTHEGEKMTLTWKEVKTKIKAKSKLFRSKTSGGKDYFLYAYNWIPDGKKEEKV